MLGAGAEIQQATLLTQGYLVFGQDPGFVRVLPMDPRTFAATGTVKAVANPVERAAGAGGIAFAASPSGVLVFAETGNDHELVWVTREGAVAPLHVDKAAYRQPRLSPGGGIIAVSANDETRRPDLWLIDVERATRRRISTEAMMPAWMPDGQRLAHSGGGASLTLTAVESGTVETLATRDEARRLLPTGTGGYPTSWSPDARYLLLQANTEDVWRLAYPEKRLEPVLAGPSAEWGAVVSRSGRAVSYVSDESGRQEVYVARWPGLEQKTAVSTRGGVHPRWSADGTELFFWQGQTLMAARISPSLRVGAPQRLFSGAFFGAGRDWSFDVAADGRFVMVKSDERAELKQLTVMQNWMGETPVSR